MKFCSSIELIKINYLCRCKYIKNEEGHLSNAKKCETLSSFFQIDELEWNKK